MGATASALITGIKNPNLIPAKPVKPIPTLATERLGEKSGVQVSYERLETGPESPFWEERFGQ